MDKLSLLKAFFGHDSFRPGQEKLVDSLLSGRDVLGVMPTGAGKSVCYQLPSLMLPGLTLVVSPLISLMKDQVAALTQAGVPAAFLNSSLSTAQYSEALRRIGNGAYKLLYIAPERLLSQSFARLAEKLEISLLAVDEAHCVSQWGQDFRPSYLQIAQFLQQLPKRPAVGAFTATATHQVKEDIQKLLLLKDPLCLTTGFDRPNLFFQVVKPKNKSSYLCDYLFGHKEQSGIIYCATRKMVEALCDSLRSRDFVATRYHAGLSDEERKQNQEDFVYDRAKIMVATNAFGMGIDKSNVNYVIHYNMPKNLESYYQEAGRAGRDGQPAQCILLFSTGDVRTAKYLIAHSGENETLSEEERVKRQKMELRRLEQMVSYCKAKTCLRACLLRYFGEEAPLSCRNCGNCSSEMETRDITIEAQKILSAVARVERKYRSSIGITVISQMLRGSKSKRVMQLGLNKLSTYGIMSDMDKDQLRDYIDFLGDEGYLDLGEGERPVVRLTEQAAEVLRGGKSVIYVCRKPNISEKHKAAKPSEVGLDERNEALYQALRKLRMELAEDAHVPAYVVFSNAVLADMAVKRPKTAQEFLGVDGVGQVKAQLYGRIFIDHIAQWEEREEMM